MQHDLIILKEALAAFEKAVDMQSLNFNADVCVYWNLWKFVCNFSTLFYPPAPLETRLWPQ